jgi:hypothetical protein
MEAREAGQAAQIVGSLCEAAPPYPPVCFSALDDIFMPTVLNEDRKYHSISEIFGNISGQKTGAADALKLA